MNEKAYKAATLPTPIMKNRTMTDDEAKKVEAWAEQSPLSKYNDEERTLYFESAIRKAYREGIEHCKKSFIQELIDANKTPGQPVHIGDAELSLRSLQAMDHVAKMNGYIKKHDAIEVLDIVLNDTDLRVNLDMEARVEIINRAKEELGIEDE